MNDLKHPQYRDPYYWAPFVLQGEWSGQALDEPADDDDTPRGTHATDQPPDEH